VIPLLILVIVPGVQIFLSTDLSTIPTDRIILRFAQCYLTVFATIQVPIVVGAWAIYFLGSKKQSGIPGFEVTIRAIIIFSVGALITWIQTVKILQAFYTPGPETATNPPWYLQRPILYSGFFEAELFCVIIYAVSSIRLRFLKPVRDGVKEPETRDGRPATAESGQAESQMEKVMDVESA
jgi:hypothetical protein